MKNNLKFLVTICGRKGSKGVPGKNTRLMHGKPLLVYSIEQAKKWIPDAPIVISTDDENAANIARQHGVLVPFMRPAELANDTAGKLPVLHHAVMESEKALNTRFDAVLDLDVTSPLRTLADIENGFQTWLKTKPDVCTSIVKSRKNPYFNMVEQEENRWKLCKALPGRVVSRQAAPKVFDMNASIYFYKRDFLASGPSSIWDGVCEMFEMPPTSAFDIDEETDWKIVETLMKGFDHGF